MEEKQIIKLLQIKKEGLEELLCQQVWNKDNLKSMYSICNMIKDIETTIKNIKIISMEKFIEEESKYYEYCEELRKYKEEKNK